jgi:hypothetical protein
MNEIQKVSCLGYSSLVIVVLCFYYFTNDFITYDFLILKKSILKKINYDFFNSKKINL